MKSLSEMVPPSARVPMSVLIELSRQVQQAGFGNVALLRALGFPPEDCNPRCTVDLIHLLRAYDLARDLTGWPDFALRLGVRAEGTSLATFDYLIATSENVGAALRLMARYSAVVTGGLVAECREPGGPPAELELVLRPPGLPARAAVHWPVLAERVLAAMLTLLRAEVGSESGALNPSVMVLDYAPPSHSATYAEVFGCVPRWCGDRCAMGFLRADVGRPLRHRDARLHAILRHEADMIVATLDAEVRYSEKVRRLIPSLLEKGQASLPVAARLLGVSPRTLQRRLREENVDFNVMVDAMRRDQCLHLLKDSAHTIEQVASMGGYAETSAFYRSFRRWTGGTPAAYRNAKSSEQRPADADPPEQQFGHI